MKLSLEVGEEKSVSIEGFGFYYKHGNGPIKVEILEQDGRVDQVSELLSGQGISGRKRFSQFSVTNLHSEPLENIEFYLGERDFVDNRMLADVDGLISVVNSGGSSRNTVSMPVTAGNVYTLLSEDISRIKAELSFSCAGRLGFDFATVSEVSGFPVQNGGQWSDQNTAPLYFYATTNGTVDIYTGLK